MGKSGCSHREGKRGSILDSVIPHQPVLGSVDFRTMSESGSQDKYRMSVAGRVGAPRHLQCLLTQQENQQGTLGPPSLAVPLVDP